MEEYDTWKANPTPENMGRIVAALDPVLHSEVQRFQGPKPLLHSKARALAVKAVRSYDPASGAQLRSWVTTNLQPLSRYGQRLRAVHAPEVAIRQSAHVNRVRQELSDEYGRDPSDTELADAVGISRKRLKSLRTLVRPQVAEGTIATPEDEDSTAGVPAVIMPHRMSVVEDMVYEALSPRDRSIFDWKTGRHGRGMLANQDIATRLGVTPALISQRSQAIADQIQAAMAREGD